MEKIKYMYVIKGTSYERHEIGFCRITYCAVVGIYSTYEIMNKAMNKIINKSNKLDYIDRVEIKEVGGCSEGNFREVYVYFKNNRIPPYVTKYTVERHPVDVYPK